MPRYSISMLSPSDGYCEHISYRGTNVRGLVACPPQQSVTDGGLNLFLDFRQIASPIQFVMLTSTRITYEALRQLLPRPPPPGWRLSIQGGRRRDRALEIVPGETLIFGFLHASVSGFEVDSSSCDSDNGEEGPEESSDNDDSRPTSGASTRSCSRHRGASANKHSPSTDHSYQGTVDHQGAPKGHQLEHHAKWEPTYDVLVELSQNEPASELEEALNLLVGKSAHYAVSYTGDIIDCRVPEVPPGRLVGLHTHFYHTTNLALRQLLPGEDRVTDLVPHFAVDRPGDAQAVQAQAQRYNARFFLFAFEYAPETVDVALLPPTSVEEAFAAVQNARSEHSARRFPQVVQVYPQPRGDFAVALALQAWCSDTYVFFDMTQISGGMFCAHISPLIDRDSILAIAELPREAAVEVYVGDLPEPLQRGRAYQMRTGSCISIVPAAGGPFIVAFLPDMLLSSEGWNGQALLPSPVGRWIHILTDTHANRMRLDSDRRLFLRQDIAGLIGADESRLTLQPAEPRLSDHCDNGIVARSVLVATEELERSVAAGAARVIYILDLRPISAGLTWGFAEHGMLRAQPIVDRCDAVSPAGYGTQLSGGQVFHTDEGLHLRLRSGEIVCVDFVPNDLESSHMHRRP